MLEYIDLTRILFFDVECVSGAPDYGSLNDTMQELWSYKAPGALRRYGEELTQEELEESYAERAGIYAEFGKIVCISVGVMYRDENQQLNIRLKSFANRDEKVLLQEFTAMLNQYFKDPGSQFLCGHNIKEFDVPYICRRILINQLKLPAMLNVADKKPWEMKHLLDTMTLWKFGEYRGSASLKLLAGVFGFPTPKDDIEGSDVGRVFYEENDLERIAVYCEKDVLATAQLFLKYQLKPMLEPEQVFSVDS